jgi:hypothetical protein
VRPARKADNSAILVAPNVKVRMETQNSFLLLSVHVMLRESFTILLNKFNIKKPRQKDAGKAFEN